ncbi:DNA-binding protein [Ligilactobacillus salitolerans]|uniref:DNA-binding protein n=1 Tax=Ligilactobacillus salitolerans TaxID=1808352 RepID=A0A401IVR0_9LACO|nr:YceD family protein [Ligilactobacillus salitolerans]GBG95624.1 DNA-binding protein [Ligilactobacillus salitolerans]
MKWSYKQLQQLGDEPLQVNEKLNLEKELKTRKPAISVVSPVEVTGVIGADSVSAFSQLQVHVSLTLPSTRSLEPATIQLSFLINENYVEADRTDFSEFSDSDLVIVLENNLLDLDKIITDNILLQIPMQVLTEAEKAAGQPQQAGQNWQVLAEDQLNTQQKDADQQVDPRLAKLAHYFDQDETDE